LHPAKEWAFLARYHDLETTHLHRLREWVAPAARVLPRAAHAQQVPQALHVPVAPRAPQVPVALRVPEVPAQVLVARVAHLAVLQLPVVSLVRVLAQPAAVEGA